MTLQGTHVTHEDPDRLAEAIEAALGYRGDVTIVRRSDGSTVIGYLFDRTSSHPPCVRLVHGNDERIAIPIEDLAAISFTGRDTAAGKSFETWMKKYVERKLAGEEASIEPEDLG